MVCALSKEAAEKGGREGKSCYRGESALTGNGETSSPSTLWMDARSFPCYTQHLYCVQSSFDFIIFQAWIWIFPDAFGVCVEARFPMHVLLSACQTVAIAPHCVLAEVTDPVQFSCINQMKTICLEKLSNPSLFFLKMNTTQNFILMDFSIFFLCKHYSISPAQVTSGFNPAHCARNSL